MLCRLIQQLFSLENGCQGCETEPESTQSSVPVYSSIKCNSVDNETEQQLISQFDVQSKQQLLDTLRWIMAQAAPVSFSCLGKITP